ncbi:MAG: lytic transglycosylase domain-containing protein [Alphaproteobacteria bacterium]|nr:lytic transglycosylase domain-containing protein [Alphaproteobacteria bacterium]
MISVTTKLSLALRLSNNATLTLPGILLIIFSLFISLTINKTYAQSHSVTPIKKPSLIELIGEKFYSPNEKNEKLETFGVETEEYIHFYEFFKEIDNNSQDSELLLNLKNKYVTDKNKITHKIIEWYILRSPYTLPNIVEMYDFMNKNQDWPDIDIIQKKIEKYLILNDLEKDFVAHYFEMHPPISGDGYIAKSINDFKIGKYNSAKESYKTAWHKMRISKEARDKFIQYCSLCISKKDLEIRFDRMLYLDAFDELFDVSLMLDENFLQLANIANKIKLDEHIARNDFNKIEDILENNSSYHYLRIKWLIILWAVQSEYLGRKLISEQRYREAYEVMTLNVEVENEIFANLEFLKGWLSLKKFNDPNRAIKHFNNQLNLTNLDENIAQANFWIAMSHIKSEETELAQNFFQISASHINSFYGLLASSYTQDNATFNIKDTNFSDEENEDINKDLIVAINILGAVDRKYLAAKFIDNIYDLYPETINPNTLSNIANNAHLTQTAIRLSKKIGINKINLEHLYPTNDFPLNINEKNKLFSINNLIHAIIHQESEFASEAISYSGAMGMMQIMPNTAKMLSRLEKIEFEEDRLSRDSSYNVILGSRYISDLINEFDGSYVYAISSYNAGPTRVRSWIRSNREIEILDWIELIPYRETRNYVKSVLRNAQYYKILLYENNINSNILYDLNRGTVN